MRASGRGVVPGLLLYFGRIMGFRKMCSGHLKRFLCFSFLVDACTSLEEYIHTEGLFRKSGSVIRLKALKVSIFLNCHFSFVP